MLIIPKENKKVLGFCSVISELNVAACPEPIPGRKEHKGEAIEQERIDLRYSLFVSFTFVKG